MVTDVQDENDKLTFTDLEAEWDAIPDRESTGLMVGWSFFQSAHGKGPSDSENSAIKNFLFKKVYISKYEFTWNMCPCRS